MSVVLYSVGSWSHMGSKKFRVQSLLRRDFQTKYFDTWIMSLTKHCKSFFNHNFLISHAFSPIELSKSFQFPIWKTLSQPYFCLRHIQQCFSFKDCRTSCGLQVTVCCLHKKPFFLDYWFLSLSKTLRVICFSAFIRRIRIFGENDVVVEWQKGNSPELFFVQILASGRGGGRW